jgi:hypothetical protein
MGCFFLKKIHSFLFPFFGNRISFTGFFNSFQKRYAAELKYYFFATLIQSLET